MVREYLGAIWGEVDRRRLAKAGGGIGGENMKENGKRMDGADKERDKKREMGSKRSKGVGSLLMLKPEAGSEEL